MNYRSDTEGERGRTSAILLWTFPAWEKTTPALVKRVYIFRATPLFFNEAKDFSQKPKKMVFCFLCERERESEHFPRRGPERILLEVIVRMSVRVCVCVWVFTQLEVESGITSPGGGSRGVCCDPIKKADRLWHPLQKTRGLHLPKYPCIRAQKAGQIPTKPPAEFT